MRIFFKYNAWDSSTCLRHYLVPLMMCKVREGAVVRTTNCLHKVASSWWLLPYYQINNYTIHNQYPLPLIADLLMDPHGTYIYTKLDMQWGYNNVCIKEGDKHKAAFKTCYGLFKLTMMFSRLTNLLATFQTMMNHIFQPLIAKHKLLGTFIHVYINNIKWVSKLFKCLVGLHWSSCIL